MEELIVLNNHPNIGSQTIKKLLSFFGDKLNRLFSASESEIARVVGDKMAKNVVEAIKEYDPEIIKKNLSNLDIGYLTIFDREYPPLLLECYDCPAVLYVRGKIEVVYEKTVAIVGSRKYTDYGAMVARKISRELCGYGITVVSGLALGIDSFAHRAAVDEGGKTAGVLGCGIDEIYPSSNRRLGEDIIRSGGAIISEYPPNTAPFKQNFPARNRIIAGMSLGVVVAEAAIDSGASITAMCALEYNRDVFAVPGRIDSETSAGTNKLISEGAKLVSSGEDVAAEYGFHESAENDSVSEIITLSGDEEIIFNAIEKEGSMVDEIVLESKINVAKVTSVLTMFEMKGILENVHGKWQRKK